VIDSTQITYRSNYRISAHHYSFEAYRHRRRCHETPHRPHRRLLQVRGSGKMRPVRTVRLASSVIRVWLVLLRVYKCF